jgi:glycosyltransferase involved in cell wall biosynthesis
MYTEKVTIVLPTYNGAVFLRQSIDSCLNQTYDNIELIIVDDGSTDETSEIIETYQDKRIIYIQHKENKGLPIALNTGFANSSGEYLTWTSDDNFYDKEAIKEMLIFLKKRECSFVFCDYYQFNDEDLSKFLIKLPDSIALKQGNQIGACFLYSREVMENIGYYDPDTKLAEDYDYWIRVSKIFPMHHLNVPLYFYRTHKKSLTVTKYYEVRVVEFFVRFKNDILSIDEVIDLFVNLLANKRKSFFNLNRMLAIFFIKKKICNILSEYRLGKKDFEKAKLSLIEIIDVNR